MNTIEQPLKFKKLSQINDWPERKLPQERFDEKIVLAMNQMCVLVGELNNSFIPNMNTFQEEEIPNVYNILNSIRENINQIETLLPTLQNGTGITLSDSRTLAKLENDLDDKVLTQDRLLLDYSAQLIRLSDRLTKLECNMPV